MFTRVRLCWRAAAKAPARSSVLHSIANYRGPALTGDVTIQTAEVTEKSVDDQGRHLIHVKHLMTNQAGKTMVTGTAEITGFYRDIVLAGRAVITTAAIIEFASIRPITSSSIAFDI